MNIFKTHTNAPLPTGIFTMGGNIITASGLIFMGATADDYLRAFDEESGKGLWRAAGCRQPAKRRLLLTWGTTAVSMW